MEDSHDVFILPTSLPTAASNVIRLIENRRTTLEIIPALLFPLLRYVGCAGHNLRMLAALLSETRVLIVSASPKRLATCSHWAQWK